MKIVLSKSHYSPRASTFYDINDNIIVQVSANIGIKFLVSRSLYVRILSDLICFARYSFCQNLDTIL